MGARASILAHQMQLFSSMKCLGVMSIGWCLLSQTVLAGSNLEPGFDLVKLHNGLNSVDVDGDGKQDTIVVAHRENFNAHSFDAATIYVWARPSSKDPMELQIVPLQSKSAKEKENTSEHLELISSGGADGLLHDFRLFVDAKHHTAVIITATRAFGESFADTQAVVFEYFELTQNTEGIPGDPILYFKSYKQVTSKKTYVDVGEAFEAELGIGPDGRYKE